MSKVFTLEEVSKHDNHGDLFMVIHGKVYDSTSFADKHPGGGHLLLEVAGQDATEAFEDSGHSDEARALLKDQLVGTLHAKDLPKVTVAQKTSVPGSKSNSSFPYLPLLLGLIPAFFAYQQFTIQKQDVKV